MKGYICLTELLALHNVHLHKNNEYYLFCVPFCFIYLFYDQITRRYGPWIRVVTRPGFSGRAGFGLKFDKIFRADFGPEHKTIS